MDSLFDSGSPAYAYGNASAVAAGGVYGSGSLLWFSSVDAAAGDQKSHYDPLLAAGNLIIVASSAGPYIAGFVVSAAWASGVYAVVLAAQPQYVGQIARGATVSVKAAAPSAAASGTASTDAFRNADALAKLVGPSGSFAIVPNDTAVFAQPTRALYVGTTGDVKVRMLNGMDQVYPAMAGGMQHSMFCDRVYALGTTATGLVGQY